MPDSLAPEDVLPRLRGRFGRDYRFEPECESTQRLLDGRPEGAVAATDYQLAGRGRLGRRWDAPPASSVMCSVVLEPRVATERLSELTVVAAAAVADAIARVSGLVASVKHPNDVMIGGRKVAGILGEASAGRVVLGIGINVAQRQDDLPDDAQHAPTSLALEGAEVARADLLAEVLAALEHRYAEWHGSAPEA